MSSIKLTADSGGGTFEVKAPASSGNTRVLTLPDAANGTVLTTTNPKTGNILQVVQTVKSDTFTHSGNTSVTDVTGLNVTITPSSNSSKILIHVFMNISNNNISKIQQVLITILSAVIFFFSSSGTGYVIISLLLVNKFFWPTIKNLIKNFKVKVISLTLSNSPIKTADLPSKDPISK